MEMNNLSAVNEMDDEEEYEDYSDDNSESSELAGNIFVLLLESFYQKCSLLECRLMSAAI